MQERWVLLNLVSGNGKVDEKKRMKKSKKPHFVGNKVLE